MMRIALIALALPLMAAAPLERPLSLTIPADGGLSFAPTPLPKAGGGRTANFQPAPLPNRDLASPAPPRASTEPTLAPTLFTTRTQFRGDGFSPGSTAQSEQEKNFKPGAGFNLHMPLTPQ